jgi:hypothetical protein
MEFLELLGFDFFGSDYVNCINDIALKKRRSSSNSQRRPSFIEEKRGYKLSGEKNKLPPSFESSEEAKEIFKLLEHHLMRYYTLVNLYSIVLCQILTSSYDIENKDDKIEVQKRMINQRIYDLQTLGAEISDNNVVSAATKDMSIFMSLVLNLFSQEIERLNNDREIYYYVKEDFMKKHDEFIENYFNKLKSY